jgi:hypothetical protein
MSDFFGAVLLPDFQVYFWFNAKEFSGRQFVSSVAYAIVIRFEFRLLRCFCGVLLYS